MTDKISPLFAEIIQPGGFRITEGGDVVPMTAAEVKAAINRVISEAIASGLCGRSEQTLH
jgi:hypothetical protein